MHWTDRIAKALLRRGEHHIIASGISISGHIHIGHSNDVFIADAIRRSIEEQGGKAEVIWYADDFDPMRRVPWPLPEKYKKYLGMPYVNIPSPDPKYKNFVGFFSMPFVKSLKSFGIQAKIHSSAEVYRSGKLADLTRVALENAKTIRTILNKYRSKPLQEDWLPYDAICGECGKLSTTRSYDWHDDMVSYACEGSSYAKGCGHEGEADFTKGEGKLTWRVEWPARWKLLGVTCEPFGKDHAVTGGSYDTGKLIARRVFKYTPPHPIPYEWISLEGKPMSSSKGHVFTLPQWLEAAEPELLRYLIFRSKAMKAKNFDPRLPLLDLYDEYDDLEGVYFGTVQAPKKREKQLKRIYEVAQVKRASKKQPQRVPFRLAVITTQVTRDTEHAIKSLRDKGVLTKPSRLDVEFATKRLKCASNWAEKHAPERLRVKLLQSLPLNVKRSLTKTQKRGLGKLAEALSKRDFEPVELHNYVYETAKEVGIKASELFKAIYLVLLGRKSGPRVGNFLTALDKSFVIKRFRGASA
jgi:lysyl-tRNA synthetase class 1